ncbi:thiosulfate/3-mercaptopyruvate sulfurtransferase [Curtobacterium pusillum]|uniref:Thiosulfate/3-mercaptopyruvate sulfurtransferase n=1 Tax=Curtobacterium pusillum TaxID=69373 RepID=A0AAW3T6T4_9MICO|nr:rhodanese-like domain-containing protein [Curtobacterium pusillum]MBA8990891.1 thiosulfate/3-mercaptopyruvate sulfurtransferase [Curtobacterium pusillum]
MAPVLTSPLVSTQWLADHLGADELVVLDASVHTVGTGLETTWQSARDSYEQQGHVPGARYADLVEAFSTPDADLPFTRPVAERFESSARDLGVTNTSTVVIYDDSVGEWSARLWWIFRSFGFDSVAVLDGGFTKWRDEGRPVRVGALRTSPKATGTSTGAEGGDTAASFLAGEERPLWADHGRVLRAVTGEQPATLVLAAPESALGTEHPPVVPGSTPIAVDALVDPETNAYLRGAALQQAFASVLDADEIVTYCGVGSAACVDALALTVLGHEKVSVYDGSLVDWWRHQPEAMAS